MPICIIIIARFQSLKCRSAEIPSSPFAWKYVKNSFTVVSLYLGGFSSDNSSLMGPYSLEFELKAVPKKQATDTLGPLWFVSTLCSTLANLSFDIS